MKKLREYTLIILFNFLVILGILYAVDFAFSPYRRLPRDGEYRGVRYTWGNPVAVNPQGFRERAYDMPKPEGVYRVMALGDSFTWGEGVAVEERYTNIAEQILNDSDLGRQFEVLSFGVRGASTMQERDLLRKYIDQVQPDLIVVGFTLNDTQPNEQNYSVERAQLDQKGGNVVRWLAKKLNDMGLRFIAQSLHDAFYLIFERNGVIPSWETALGRTYDESSEEWQTFLRALEGIKWASDHRDLPPPIFAVLNQGSSNTAPSDYSNPDERLQQYLAWYHQVETAAQAAGFVVYNHEAEIAAQLNSEPLTVNQLDNHPSARLHQIYGVKLAEVIMALLEEND